MVPGTTPEPLLLWFWMSLFVCWMVITALALAAAFSASEQRRTRMLSDCRNALDRSVYQRSSWLV